MMRRWRRILLGLPLLGALMSALPGSGTPLAAPPSEQGRKPPELRVRLLESAASFRIRGYDLRWSQGDSHRVADRNSEWDVACKNGQVIAVPVETRGRGAVRAQGALRPVQGPLLTVSSPTGFLKWRERGVREMLVIRALPESNSRTRRAGEGTRCEWVNVLDLEKYLEGLVNVEFNSRWAAAAVDAQVIVARSYALHQRALRRKDRQATYDVDSTVKDQVYEGPDREDRLGSQSVVRTRGLALLAPGGARSGLPVKAFYHSTCGGQTELPQSVWGQGFPGVERRVSCPHCWGSPRYRWSFELSLSELERRVKSGVKHEESAKPFQAALPGARLIGVSPIATSRGARAAFVELSWEAGAGPSSGRKWSFRVPANRFREWLGYDHLRSTLFDVHWGVSVAGPLRAVGRLLPLAAAQAASSVPVRFEGRGYGHGVGLCQWGAKTLGERGASTEAILQAYFPGVALKKLYE